ncbi:haloacid dehalogenase superfamily, subfamily IA, variant 3 with third motif having DD or ED/haloacid dehalogenase superfamily, subfamily IA, variant 1 with third motif having Dx(3-4)D or Dx(3-4)E [Streptococcus equinus]|nr:haloacid dehalogenase superfamily, subfamily IA, variant 3 with third motif having DD or ED/haloacid dehalogenase superfamily, subfamily IA, variant 1 with third motif having Dx(3-4)D or Dx(3-4)E [Streptococcus equinus]
MTTLIWDFDGTLVDSYEAIGEALKVTYAHYDLVFDEEWVMSFIIKESVKALLYKVAKEEDLDFAELSTFFKKEQEARDHMIKPMPHLVEVLKQTKQAGVSHFVYTHKGITANDVLERLGVRQYFTEVVTSANGFARKPEPEAINYLIEKYALDKADTFYVGDRRIDVEAAENAGIKSINLGQPDSKNNQKIASLSEFITLFKA